MKILMKDREKTYREIERNNATNWSEHDIRRKDDNLHEKMKAKMKKAGKE